MTPRKLHYTQRQYKKTGEPVAIDENNWQAREADRVFLEALRTGKGPTELVWDKRWQPGENHEYQVARATEYSPNYVQRDPCPMCGIRADYGCAHRAVPA